MADKGSGKGTLVVSILLALLFLATGIMKLTGQGVEQFAGWGYPAWFQYLIGVAETAAGIGFLVKKTRFFAAAAMIVVMLGAIYTVVSNDGVDPTLAVPLVALLLCALVAKKSR